MMAGLAVAAVIASFGLGEGGGKGAAEGRKAGGGDRPPFPLAIHNESDWGAEPGRGKAGGRKAPWPIVAALAVVAGVVVTPAAPAAPATGAPRCRWSTTS